MVDNFTDREKLSIVFSITPTSISVDIFVGNHDLQSRLNRHFYLLFICFYSFLTKAQRYIDGGRHL